MKKIVLNTKQDWIDWADARSIPEPNTGCHLWTGSLNNNLRPTAAALYLALFVVAFPVLFHLADWLRSFP